MGVTKRCTGVAAGGCSVFRASTGRNPVNAVVMPAMSETDLAFERKLTKGQALWVTHLLMDFTANRVELSCTSTPDNGVVDRRVIFNDVRKLDFCALDKSEPDFMCSLLGIITIKRPDCLLYQINTETIEMVIDTSAEPIIQEIASA